MSPCQLIIVLFTALLMTVCSSLSPADQDKQIWTDHDPWSWSDCSMPDSPLVMNKSSINIQPIPLQVGRRWNFSFTFENKEELTGGTINLIARWSPDYKQPFIVLIQEQLQLCDFAEKVWVGCPVQTGLHHVKYENRVSPILPSGYYSFNFSAEDQKNLILCVKGLVKIE